MTEWARSCGGQPGEQVPNQQEAHGWPRGRPERAMTAALGHRAEPSGAKGVRIPRILAPGTHRRAAVQLLRRTESDSVVSWEWPS